LYETLPGPHSVHVGAHHLERLAGSSSVYPAAHAQFDFESSLKMAPAPADEQMSAESADCVAVTVAVTVTLGERVAAGDAVPLTVPETERDDEGVTVGDGDSVGDGLCVRDGVAEGVPLPERVTVPLGLADLEPVGVGDEQGLALPLVDPDLVRVGEGEPVLDGEVVGDGEVVWVPDPVRVMVGDGDVV